MDFLHPHPETVVVVAVDAQRHIEFHSVVGVIGFLLAPIPVDAAGPQYRPADRTVDCHFRRQGADAAGSHHQDFVFQQKLLDFGELNGKVGKKLLQGRPELRGSVGKDAAGAHIADGNARPAQHLEKFQDTLPAAETIHQRRPQCAQLLHKEPDGNQVAGDALQLGGQGAQVLTPGRRLNVQQLLYREAISLIVNHRGSVVQAIGEGYNLDIVALLGQFFGAAVQVAENRLYLDDFLAVKGNPHPKHPMGAGVLRPHIDGHRFSAQGHNIPSGGPAYKKSLRRGWPAKPSHSIMRFILGWPAKRTPIKSQISRS